MCSLYLLMLYETYVTQIVSLGYLWRNVLSGEERVETAVSAAG